MLNSVFKNKRAQIGETMTWIVATLVIVVILGISVFVAVPLKGFNGFKFYRKADFLATKSFVNYLSKNGIYDKIKQEKKIPDDGLKEKIENFYQSNYDGGAQFYITAKDSYDISASLDVAEEVKCQVDIRTELNNEKDILFCLGSKGAE